MRPFHSINKILAATAIHFIVTFRPLLGPSNICPFTIGCTQYAILELKTSSFPRASIRIVKRLLLCNPLGGLLMRYL